MRHRIGFHEIKHKCTDHGTGGSLSSVSVASAAAAAAAALATATIAGDFTADGVVDSADLQAFVETR